MSSEEDFDEFEEILTLEEQIELFIHNYSYSILLLSEDVKNRFYHFLYNTNSSKLMEFIIDCKFKTFFREYSYIPSTYINEFSTEIDTTLFVVNNFLMIHFKKFQISRGDWIDFCFTHH